MAKKKKSAFEAKFAAERKAKGPGQTFTFNGKSYSTNTAEDKVKAAPTTRPKANPQAGKPSVMSKAPEGPTNKPKVDTPTNRPKANPRAGKPSVMSTAPKGPTKPATPGNITTKAKATPAKATPAKAPTKIPLYKEGSAYAKRMAKGTQRQKDIEQAFFDQRLNNAEPEAGTTPPKPNPRRTKKK